MIDPSNPDYANTPASASRRYGRFQPVDVAVEPVVSIVTPFFNTGPVFEETAESIFRQTFQQWEWLIINDGSSDPSALAVLDAYRQDPDPRIRVVDLARNAGPSAARNYGVEQARSSYIYHLDSDDLIEPTTVEKCFWFLATNPDCPWVNGWSVGFGAEEYLWQNGFHSGEKFLQQNLVTGRTMVRKTVHRQLHGYDAGIQGGYEDWDFWLKGAEAGVWGATIPEYFDWYRRREQHWTRWELIADSNKTEAFRDELSRRFPRIFSGNFPGWEPQPHLPMAGFQDELPAENRIARGGRHLVMILPWMAMGGADKFNLDLIDQLQAAGWTVSVVTTKGDSNPWRSAFEQRTPEVFTLANFVHSVSHPLFLRYLIHSRQPDAVLLSGSELGYWLLPYLRWHFPQVPFVDYCHIEESYWKNGGYPRYAACSQAWIERNLVSSNHLRNWMVREHGADAGSIDVVTTNIDANLWEPNAEVRQSVRLRLDIPESMPLILFTGRFCVQKQPEVLARTLLRLHEQGVSFRAILAGEGQDRPWLETFVREHKLANCVQLPGAVSLDEVRQLMQAADIFFLPSLWEGIALSVYEAMATGLAVVTADVGGQREVLTDDVGIRVTSQGTDDVRVVETYANALRKLIENPEERKAMGRAARERIVHQFSLDEMGDRFLQAVEHAELIPASPRDPLLGAFAHEQAVRALEYFRLEAIADALWQERKSASAFSSDLSFTDESRDPLREWEHIHRFIPFKLYRLFRSRIVPAIRGDRFKDPCYDEQLSVRERLDLLKASGFFIRLMRLRRFKIMRPLLPRVQ